jgi:hypothetical protein
VGTHVTNKSFLDTDSVLASLVLCVENLLSRKSVGRECGIGDTCPLGLGHDVGLLIV